jgi:hypothetical protein
MPVTFKQQKFAPLVMALAAQLVTAYGATAETIKDKTPSQRTQGAMLDPSVIDPVGKLHEISNSVSQSSSELTSISQALDKLNDELARVEKERPAKVTKASFESLQKRFKDTIDRSYVVEKRVKDSLAQSQRDIENVYKALKNIQAERVAGTARKAVMTDAEIAECLKDLDDERATIKALQESLVDDEAKPKAKVEIPLNGTSKEFKSRKSLK